MRGQLASLEPKLLEMWHQIHLAKKQREVRVGKPLFVLHDGPPYANGAPHMGHVLNRLLKDVINRWSFMQGKDVVFVPGWDCHGLPIESKVEEDYRKKGVQKKDVDTTSFRQACRETAAYWMGVQKTSLARLGLFGDWEHPYATMDPETEYRITELCVGLLLEGHIVRGVKPVWWSPSEETALAEAEMEYKEIVSQAMTVSFRITEALQKSWVGSEIPIWTTMPWTLPGNRAIACHRELTYGLVTWKGRRLWIAENRLSTLEKLLGSQFTFEESVLGASFEGLICAHPLEGYNFPVPVLHGDHVKADAGTGFVHIAPGHGEDDFALAQKHALEIPEMVSDKGYYHDHVPLFGGKSIFDIAPMIRETLGESCIAQEAYTHSYPHSWRSKKPLISRVTPQWFIRMDEVQDDTLSLRDQALKAISQVAWCPPQGENRIRSMLKNRPDWCLSRQRIWGVPMGIIVDRETQEPLREPEIYANLLADLKTKGVDLWFDPTYLPKGLDPKKHMKIMDIVDVWFESGVSHQYVLKERPELRFPADLYLEGSDQHRAYFQTSLLTSCLLEGGKAPYHAILTHGFIVDETGDKLSKSKGGGALTLEKACEQYGADVLRLWACNADFTQDITLSESQLMQAQDMYRKFRNVLRYLLGAVDGYTQEEAVLYQDLPEYEQWFCHVLKTLEIQLSEAYTRYDLSQMLHLLYRFCAQDLSAFFCDVRKDILYCDALDSQVRRSFRTVLNQTLQSFVRWMAAFLPFTCEEVWQALHTSDSKETSIHLQQASPLPDAWLKPALSQRYDQFRQDRKKIQEALEQARAQKKIKSSLEAAVIWKGADEKRSQDDWDLLASLCLVAHICPVKDENEMIFVEEAPGKKCERCWRILPEVEEALCQRCTQVVQC